MEDVEDDFEEMDVLEELVERENAGRYIAEAIVFVLWGLDRVEK